MATSIDSNLIALQPKKMRDIPRLAEDKRTHTPESLGLDRAILNPIPTKPLNEPLICKIIKVFPKGSQPKVGSPLYFPSALREESSKPIIQALAVNITSRDQFIPFPSNILEPNDEQKYLEGLYTYVYSDDDGIVSKNLAIYDEIEVKYTSLNEAKIISVRSQNNGVGDSSPTSPLAAQGGSTGETLGSSNNNTLGEGKEPSSTSNNANPDGKCGNGTAKYPIVDCKSAAFEATGQVVTLHPVYWDTINNLFKEIKEKENINLNLLKVNDGYRSEAKQYKYRTDRCPAALVEKQGYNTKNGKKVPGPVGGEYWLKRASWSDVIGNFNCIDKTPVGPAAGGRPSNHRFGLAVDVATGVADCKSKNISVEKYERCLATSISYRIIKKYSEKYDIKNLVGPAAEVWHWSWNGG